MYCMEYVIKPGDTLYKISRQLNVPLEDIIRANPYVNVYYLQVDDVICVPVSVPQNNYTNYTTYLVMEEDSLGSILENFDINLADLMQFNELYDIRLQPGTTLRIPLVGSVEEDITL